MQTVFNIKHHKSHSSPSFLNTVHSFFFEIYIYQTFFVPAADYPKPYKRGKILNYYSFYIAHCCVDQIFSIVNYILLLSIVSILLRLYPSRKFDSIICGSYNSEFSFGSVFITLLDIVFEVFPCVPCWPYHCVCVSNSVLIHSISSQNLFNLLFAVLDTQIVTVKIKSRV